ncbi:MAG TPA: hypothetical protein VJ874_03735 [Candidatus Thermoplasmatota archaeon]|nr:hypothetical protein [Candidatus Thermoplasmatota archaeon]
MAPEPTPTWQTAPAETANPMAIHVKVVAILEIVWGVLAAIGALFILLMITVATGVTSSTGAPGFVPGIIASFGLFILVIVAGLAVLALLGGTRLLRHRRSGRTLTYVSAALSLLSFPIGTAFGIYAFIILTRPDTDRLLTDP